MFFFYIFSASMLSCSLWYIRAPQTMRQQQYETSWSYLLSPWPRHMKDPRCKLHVVEFRTSGWTNSTGRMWPQSLPPPICVRPPKTWMRIIDLWSMSWAFLADAVWLFCTCWSAAGHEAETIGTCHQRRMDVRWSVPAVTSKRLNI